MQSNTQSENTNEPTTELDQIAQTLHETQQELQSNSFAVEMLKEQRVQNKRKDRMIVVLLILWFATILLFVLHLNSYDYSGTSETVDIQATQTGDGTNTVVGGDYDYGADSSNS